MAGQGFKSSCFMQLAAPSDVRALPILYHFLTLATVRYTLRAVCSGHKLDTLGFELKDSSRCKLLRSKRKLVAGGGIEPPTLGL
jgi:hypothetical protein